MNGTSLCIARVTNLKTLEDMLSEFKSYGSPFELSIVLLSGRRSPVPLIPLSARLTCDYCGKGITAGLSCTRSAEGGITCAARCAIESSEER